MNAVRIPLILHSRHDLHRDVCTFRTGVPLPRGSIGAASGLTLVAADGRPLAFQVRELARWSDRSVKWVLLDAVTSLGPKEQLALTLTNEPQASVSAPVAVASVSETESEIVVNTGTATFRISRKHIGPLADVQVGGAGLLSAAGCSLVLRGADGALYEARAARVSVERSGPVRVDVVSEGSFVSGGRSLRFTVRSTFHAGSSAVQVEVKLLNPHLAHHRGGLWDLGDPGSYYLKDLSLTLAPAGVPARLRWSARPDEAARNAASGNAWVLYQDSSGGEQWNSDNHVDRNGQPTVQFRGFEVREGDSSTQRGERATPHVALDTESGWVAIAVANFWQNFPKALRWQDGVLSAGLFPAESRGEHELQGGEQKRHVVWLDFGVAGEPSEIPGLQQPVLVAVHPAWIEASGAVPYFVAAPVAGEVSARCEAYVGNIVEGPGSFFHKREVIDEYGWRNFGDLYADHEAVRHKGPRPLVSHYNNQYDFIYGAFLHFLRTGDERWLELMTDAARHTADIDIYHTSEDRAAFNHGLFWHTDHYKPALTCTHRTYSAGNSGGGSYGGGPSNEQNYTSGLLHYYYLTGDEEARAAVLGLADWVIAMDDPATTLLAVVSDAPTGLASKTVSPDFHKPGRGAGNSINALLDGYALSGDRRYVAKAEELLTRCIHPNDDIAALGLLEPEYRWSYLVFLQILAKYLDQKAEWGEKDYYFCYARDSLLHYARWMAANEVPYKDVLHKVEIPTETWPAHDVRKCHVLHAAARYAPEAERAALRSRAEFFYERCIADVMSFETSLLTRPLVILCVYGLVHDFYSKRQAGYEYFTHNYQFGAPKAFVSQRQDLKPAIARKLGIVGSELGRIARDRVHALKQRFRKP